MVTAAVAVASGAAVVCAAAAAHVHAMQTVMLIHAWHAARGLASAAAATAAVSAAAVSAAAVMAAVATPHVMSDSRAQRREHVAERRAYWRDAWHVNQL